MTKIMVVAAAVLLGTAAFANAAEKSSTYKSQDTQSSTTNTGKSASDNNKNKGTVGMSGSHKSTTSSDKTKSKY